MILLGAHYSQGFSDKTFERSDSKSGILDINSALRRKVDGIGGPPTERVSDNHDRPLTTWFAPGVGGGSDRAPYNATAPGRPQRPIFPGRTVHKNTLNVNATSAEIFIRGILNECHNVLYASRVGGSNSGAKGLMYEPTAVGRQPHIHIE
jgi:hypothetical protein